MRALAIVRLSPLLVFAALLEGCPTFSDDLCAKGACDPSTTGDGGPDAAVRDPCFDTPADAACLDDASALFVSTSGDDGAGGTKAKPLKTVTAAIGRVGGARRRIYVCAGTYAEDLSIGATATGMTLIGGFTCDWVRNPDERAVLGAGETAVHIRDAAVAISDVEIQAKDSVAGSSIGVFASGATLDFRHVAIFAGKGADGADGAPGATGVPVGSLDGNNAMGGSPGEAKTCTCSTGGTTVGGRGGESGVPGMDGAPKYSPASPLTSDGAGGIVSKCQDPPHAGGADGSAAQKGSDGSGAAAFGVLDESGWHSSSGMAGHAGSPGQGGGGGAGYNLGQGGGGGCGGCGGAGGGGGIGGGSSFGVAARGSTIRFMNGSIGVAAGHSGGSGIAGASGTPGGASGTKAGMGCNGGNGGAGSAGGAGGGGAGGVSVGILLVSSQHQEDVATLGAITTGAAGKGGSGAANNSGIDGISAKVLDLDHGMP